MRPLLPVLSACLIGAVVGVAGGLSNRTGPATGESAATPAVPGSARVKPSGGALAYEVVESEDFDLAGRRRISIKVVIKGYDAGSDRVRNTLLNVARNQNADAVLVFAYGPGDDWQGPYTLGKLEWGRNGGGWASSAKLPTDGVFEGKPELRAGTRSLPAAPSSVQETHRVGRVNYSLVETFKTAWRKDRFKYESEYNQKRAIALIIAVVRTDVHDPADREATLDYISQTIGSW